MPGLFFVCPGLRYIAGMQRWRKALSVWAWIMVLVMPLAGLAATARPCLGGAAPTTHRSETTPSSSPQAPCHLDAGMALAADGMAAAVAASLGDGGHHCSACAACVSAAALPAAAQVPAALALSTPQATPPLPHEAGAPVGVPERPPRPRG